MSRDQGKQRIEQLVARGQLQRVPASQEAARVLLEQARRHLSSAARVADEDPQGAYALAYDATRKAMAAVFEARGLRATAAGGHVVLYDAAVAVFDPSLRKLFQPFNRMRVRRNQVEYTSTENPPVTAEEVRRDIAKARTLLDDFAVPAIGRGVLD